jgi:hypothetical protein
MLANLDIQIGRQEEDRALVWSERSEELDSGKDEEAVQSSAIDGIRARAWLGSLSRPCRVSSISHLVGRLRERWKVHASGIAFALSFSKLRGSMLA